MSGYASPVWHPFTQHGLGEPIPLIERAEGARLYASDGRTFIDAISSWWVITHGHCHPKIQAAIRAETEKLDQLIFAGWTHEQAETLALSLVDLTPEPLKHVFFSDSGSTSVEVALKMALGYWRSRGEPRHRILVMEHGYHGDTIGAMSVGARGVFNQAYEPLLFDVGTVPFPSAGAEQASLDALDALCRAEPKAAAFVVEPLILGAGGMLIYGAETLAAMRAICARHKVIFIADEVMTGWGRTGTLFACDQADIAPDIMCLSKGLTGGALPLAVTLAIAPIFEAHRSEDRARMFFHSSSYTANPAACAAANANIAIWRDEPVLERTAAVSRQQAQGLAQLACHSRIRALRQLGTILAMDVKSSSAGYLSTLGPQMTAAFRERGLLLRPLGSTIYIMPPYSVTSAELGQVYAAISDVVEQLP